MFEIRNLSLSFAGRRLLEPTDLIFERGKVYTIYGKSGVGKSSLLNKIALLRTLVFLISSMEKRLISKIRNQSLSL